MFQYKILHDIVYTKNNLFKAKPASSDLCYLLVSCPVVSEFWKTFLVWYETYTSTKLELSAVKIPYGTVEDDRLINSFLSGQEQWKFTTFFI